MITELLKPLHTESFKASEVGRDGSRVTWARAELSLALSEKLGADSTMTMSHEGWGVGGPRRLLRLHDMYPLQFGRPRGLSSGGNWLARCSDMVQGRGCYCPSWFVFQQYIVAKKCVCFLPTSCVALQGKVDVEWA